VRVELLARIAALERRVNLLFAVSLAMSAASLVLSGATLMLLREVLARL